MATIFFRIMNEETYLISLLTVFRNQLDMGKHKLKVTIKQSSGIKSIIQGTIDEVFDNKVFHCLKNGDILILEHTYKDCEFMSDAKFSCDIHYNTNLQYVAEDLDDGCYFLFPLSNKLDTSFSLFYIIRNYPMYAYKIRGNEIISDKMLGKYSVVMNNVYGRITNSHGVVSKRIII